MGEATYADKSEYAGGFRKGERHGDGVSSFIDDYGNACRYEGGWERDARSGVGLVVGGAYRFLVGAYEDDAPVGVHVAFDFTMDSTVTIDMD